MPRKPLHVVTSPKAWKVLIAPVRAEIIETLRMLGPCGIADVARQLDRPADSLYKHFEKLVAAGVVVERGTRPAGRRTERVYDMVADDITPRFGNAGEKAVNDAFLTTAKTILGMTSRTFRDAAAARQLVGLGLDKPRNTRAFFEHVWLTDADFAELNGLFIRVKRFLDTKKTRTPDTRLELVAVLAAPIVRRRGAKPTAATSTRAAITGRGRRPPPPSSSRPPSRTSPR